MKIIYKAVPGIFLLISSGAFSADVIHVNTCSNLLAITNNDSQSYVLDHDIDCTYQTQTNEIRFKGTLDGKGYSIYGLEIAYSDTAGSEGLFSRITGGTVKNLTLADVTYHGEAPKVGALAGAIIDSSVSNVTVKTSFLQATTKHVDAIGAIAGVVDTESLVDQVAAISNTISVGDTDAIGSAFGQVKSSSKVRNMRSLGNSLSTTDKYKTSIGGAVGEMMTSASVSGIKVGSLSISAPNLTRGQIGYMVGHMQSSGAKLSDSGYINGDFTLDNDHEFSGLYKGYWVGRNLHGTIDTATMTALSNSSLLAVGNE